MHSYWIYDALCAHRRGRGDKHKNGHFLACHHKAHSTPRTVTSNGMSNHLSYHHKAYYVHIEMYKCIVICAIWTPERIFINNKTYHFCY